MIPPPPTLIQTSTEKIDRTKTDHIETSSSNPSVILSPSTLKDPETLTPNEADSSKPTSPSCLRPYRKVEDVTTVKRQPKSGWL